MNKITTQEGGGRKDQTSVTGKQHMDRIPQGPGQKDSIAAAVWFVEVLLRGAWVNNSLETGSNEMEKVNFQFGDFFKRCKCNLLL